MKKTQKKLQKKPTITILIAARNEAEGLQKIIQSIRRYADEIILVDGHSTDTTFEIATKERVRYFLDHGKGRGDALKIGIAKAQGDIIVCFDADGSHEASDIPLLIAQVQKGAALVMGSRRTGGSFDAEITMGGMLRSFGSDLLTYIVNRHFHTHFTDIIYSFRAMNSKIAKRLPLDADGFSVEQEMVIRCCQLGLPVVEIPSREKARAWGASKLRTIGGIKLLFLLFTAIYSSPKR